MRKICVDEFVGVGQKVVVVEVGDGDFRGFGFCFLCVLFQRRKEMFVLRKKEICDV